MRLRLNLSAQRKREKPPDIVVDITEMLCDKPKGEKPMTQPYHGLADEQGRIRDYWIDENENLVFTAIDEPPTEPMKPTAEPSAATQMTLF
jgi:hypothetical protein